MPDNIQVLEATLDSENLKELFVEQQREEALSKQAVLQVQKYEREKVKESNLDAIIQKALSKKKMTGMRDNKQSMLCS